MKFPFTLIDNFYDNPHEIRNFALNLNYQRTSPLIFPALRSDLIHEIDKNFFDKSGNLKEKFKFPNRYDQHLIWEYQLEVMTKKLKK